MVISRLQLAVALEQVLGKQFDGQLQLIGHSHGSKVATVAADALMNDTEYPIHVNQITLLDSPETGGTSVIGGGLSSFHDANDNWYFLSDLNISDSGTISNKTTFVDNYWSFLGEPYNGITQFNLETTTPTPLTPVIRPVALDPVSKFSRMQPVSNRDNSRMLQAKHTSTLASPAFILKNDSTNGASLTLKENHSESQSLTTSFTSANSGHVHGPRGLLFDYQFTNFTRGDLLRIYIDGDLVFRMQPYIIEPGLQASNGQTAIQKGTISVGDPAGLTRHQLKFVFSGPVKNSTSSVTISNLEQYAYN